MDVRYLFYFTCFRFFLTLSPPKSKLEKEIFYIRKEIKSYSTSESSNTREPNFLLINQFQVSKNRNNNQYSLP